MNLKALSKNVRRARWGKGLCVVTRDPAKSNRLNVSSFSSTERAQDFARRAALNGVRVLRIA